MATVAELRRKFLEYFQQQGHLVVPSSSLVPTGDPTLLLTTAGMVQMKPYFLGLSSPPNKNLVSSQKCFRATDIESVGDSKHLTFFEMMGNFSVGDYFKPEAITYGWDFCINWLNLPGDRLFVTIHHEDDESMSLWETLTGISTGRIYRYDEKDNWWGPPGSEGPCGPCSEIHYDFGESLGCDRLASPEEIISWVNSGMELSDQPGCHPNCNRCDRFVELWNLVFMQFYQDSHGQFSPLDSPNIDTGLGLERAAVISQNVRDVYETDVFLPIIETVKRITGQSYGDDPAVDRNIRIVAEHGRAATFLTSDGVIPTNEGRGYVLRRLVRRAVRFGKKLGLDQNFLGEIVDSVCGQMGDAYPELVQNQKFIRRILAGEEEQYGSVAVRGISIVNGMANFRKACKAMEISEVLSKNEGLTSRIVTQIQDATQITDSGETVGIRLAAQSLDQILESSAGPQSDASAIDYWLTTLSGFEAFSLQDTYGFPLEETQEVGLDHKLSVDIEGFVQQMEAQKERGRLSAKFGDSGTAKIFRYQELTESRGDFVGYECLRATATISALLSKERHVTTAREGEQVEILLSRTPFYPEGGGQIGDIGEITGGKLRIRVTDTQTPIEGMIIHQGHIQEGTVNVGDSVNAMVDEDHRSDVTRNHTATHLLHAALRQVVGTHIRQAGSLVAHDRLRFDFTHVEPISGSNIRDIETLVNAQIRNDQSVSKTEMPYQEAIAEGALAFFGDRYGSQVRVVKIGGDGGPDLATTFFSKEVCGGTHLDRSGEIGLILITSEGSIGSGIRRMEAVTGRVALDTARNNLTLLDSLSRKLESSTQELELRVGILLDQLEAERKHIQVLERERAMAQVDNLLTHVQDCGGISVLIGEVSATSSETLREIGDRLKAKLGSCVIVLGAIMNDRPSVVAMVTDDLVGAGINAVDIVKQIAAVIGGGGGGRADVAQAGGSKANKLTTALSMVPSIVSPGLK